MLKMKVRLVLSIALLFLVVIIASCSPRQVVKDPLVEDQEGAVTAGTPVWSEASDCESCHVAQVASGSDSKCGFAAHLAESAACGSCHKNSDGKLAKGHENYAFADQPVKLKRSAVADASCTSVGCHDDAKPRIEATEGLTLLTDSNGTTVNPHDLPATRTHLETDVCSSCHKMHRDSSPEELAPALCIGCHHQDVYECGTCHN